MTTDTKKHERPPSAQDQPVVAPLPRGDSPESLGVSSSGLLSLLEAAGAKNLELHSFLLLRHGKVAAEGWWRPYGPEHPHMLFSLSKSFTATAAGLAIGEGLLSLDDPVLSFFPEDAPVEAGGNLGAMRVRHLLTMTTGHAEDTLGSAFGRADGNWARAFLEQPVEHAPGTHFVYNSGATYMVSAILQKVTGKTLLDYLQPRLFGPLGIGDASWESCPRGVNVGGWGLSIRTEDIARFGQLYLQNGVWEGERLLPEVWVEEATTARVPNGDPATGGDWSQGYGYQFWRSRYGAYRGDGAFGQFCVVLPEQDAVLAITAGTSDMQGVLNSVWEHLLPAFAPGTLPEDASARDALRRALKGLRLGAPEGNASSPLTARVSGGAYEIERNEEDAPEIEAVAFEFPVEGGSAVRVRDRNGEHRIVCGSGGEWVRGTTRWAAGARRLGRPADPEPHAVAATGAWAAEDTYIVKLCFYETPFCTTLTCRFVGVADTRADQERENTADRLLLDARVNVAFGPVERPRRVGRRTAGH